jgi:hypothetical protein
MKVGMRLLELHFEELREPAEVAVHIMIAVRGDEHVADARMS